MMKVLGAKHRSFYHACMPDPATVQEHAFEVRYYIIPALSGVTSFIGAWLAAKFALRNFYQEKIWERKTAAYTAIFEALHYIGKWHEEHYEAALIHKDIDEAKKQELQAKANQAEDELERRLASETWLIPPQCRARLEKMTADLKNSAHRTKTWQEFLDETCFIIKTATDDVRTLVVQDLQLSSKWYRKIF